MINCSTLGAHFRTTGQVRGAVQWESKIFLYVCTVLYGKARCNNCLVGVLYQPNKLSKLLTSDARGIHQKQQS